MTEQNIAPWNESSLVPALGNAELAECSPAALLAVDANGTILAHNPALTTWLQTPGPRPDLRGQNFVSLLTASARLLYETHIMPKLFATGHMWDAVLNVRDAQGQPRPVRCNAVLHTTDAGPVIHIAAFDASGRIAFERELVEAKRRADQAAERLTLLQEATSALAVARGIDDLGSTLVTAASRALNAAWTAVRIRVPGSAGGPESVRTWGELPPGFALAEELTSERIPSVFRSPEDLAVASAAGPVRLAGPETEALVMSPIVCDPERGATVLGDVICGFRRPRTLDPHELETLHALCAQAERVLEHLHLQEQLRHRAMHDTLTNLPNRAMFAERLEQSIAHATRTQAPCAVLFLDLDGFKAINDGSGHGAGDAVLQTVARRLRESCRAEDTVSRLGGDEFVIAATGLDRAGARILAERVRAAVRAPLAGIASGAQLSCSVGVLWWDPAAGYSAPSVADVLSAADAAMYAAKRGGKDSVTLREWGVADPAPDSGLVPLG
ncbi:GGDEF domain-containing protein [Leucobacter sp. 7(1)]|uniref:GGDEF domain-containing protein n=1 Tax=Leucobacter sp. 7(1) TaxID=1255613 RepID=UPI000B358781|nr:GGDEF domain-containing protein [Leucobacter sp. 7(1)]